MKQSTVLNVEFNFDSNGTPRFSIKNHTEPIKNKNHLFTMKNKHYFMHQLAAFYGVGTYAMGCEPNRYVVVCGSFDISQIPRILSSKKAQ
jgi:hypothetical protein